MTFDVFDVIQTWGQRIVDIDDNDLPVGLAFVEQRHDAENLDLLDLAWFGDQLTDLADIEGVVVTFLLGLGMRDIGILPGLREGAVIPEVALVGEAVSNESKLALLGVLFDRVKLLVFGDLKALSVV